MALQIEQQKGFKIIIIDNYDSFTFNIQHYVEPLVEVCEVVNIDKVNIASLSKYDKIIFSPGPGLPKEKPILWKILDQYQNTKPILGICFGHQAIAEYYGSQLFNMKEVHHGLARQTQITDHNSLWKNLPSRFETGRYHSWAVKKEGLSSSLKIIAEDAETGVIMALSHKTLNIKSVQFHPESILTEYGKEMIKNWIFD